MGQEEEKKLRHERKAIHKVGVPTDRQAAKTLRVTGPERRRSLSPKIFFFTWTTQAQLPRSRSAAVTEGPELVKEAWYERGRKRWYDDLVVVVGCLRIPMDPARFPRIPLRRWCLVTCDDEDEMVSWKCWSRWRIG